MPCAYCGLVRPWLGPDHRRWWPSSTYAQCWPCAVRWDEARRRPPAWWWRILARLVRVDWSGPLTGRRVWIPLRGPIIVPDPAGGPGATIDGW